ncbi:Transposable element P transposase [Frankliniella fusca]|uniref:Transposable element P transposase n=1 Tax=Frankliniella fusca TaxID=407009 RepID=A0AAE1LD36_9NEOP|nr:Transposable element P transposase [Frankliniella fusca]
MESEEETEVKVCGFRGRRAGSRRQIGKRRKDHSWKQWKDSISTSATSSNQSSDTDAIDVSEGLGVLTATCGKSISEDHECFESEGGFSETASEFQPDTDENFEEDESQGPKKKKRIRRSFLSRQRKRQNLSDTSIPIPSIFGPETRSAEAGPSTHTSQSKIDTVEVQTQTLEPINAYPDKGPSICVQHDNTDKEDPSSSQNLSDISLPSDIDWSGINSDNEPSISGSQVEPETKSGVADPNVPTSQCEIKTIQPQTLEPTDADPDAFFSLLMSYLKLLLPEDWQYETIENNILRMLKLNTSKNASVESCVYFDHKDGSVGLFVHGVPVPSENKVFNCPTVPDTKNIGSLADYLCQLVSRLQSFTVCDGIKEYEELWDTSRGFLDFTKSEESPCFRNAQCLFLIPAGNRKVCQCCQAQLQKFGRELKMREKEKEDPSKIPDKHLSKEAIKAKKDKYRKLHKAEKQRADRLQKRVDSLQIRLDEVLRDELSSILRMNQHKMTPLQKTFWESQMKVLSLSDKRGMRWHPMLIRLALHLHSLSDTAYEFINTSQIFTLPSSRRLFDYSHFIQSTEGCQQELTDQIKDKINKCGEEEHFKYINLMFDEMHIRSGLVFSRSTGELIGYTKLSGVEEELQKMQSELNSKTYKPKLAKKVLVFMAQGITSDIKDVVAVFSTDDLSSSHLYDRTWDVIYHLEESDIKVLTVTCDGASINRKFICMHERLDESFAFCYSTKNLAAGDSRPLFFILDPPHLLKAIRNALANSFSHSKSRKLWKNGQFLSWKVVETLFALTKDKKFRGHKLTKAHVKLTAFSCMTVLLATQVLSSSVANCIEELSSHESMKTLDTSELIIFIRKMNKFFDSVNGQDESGEGKNPDKLPFTSSDDERFNFLENDFLSYFEEWKQDVINRPGIFTNGERSRMIISHQALGAIQITVKGIAGAIRYMLDVAGAPSVCARVFNQDPLEQYFSKVRRKQGDNRNPTLKSVLDTRMNLHAQGSVSLPSQKGNTEALKRKGCITVDSTPLPSRKAARK